MGTQFSDKEQFDIHEVEMDDPIIDSIFDENLAALEEEEGHRDGGRTRQRQRTRQNKKTKVKKERKNKYGWAFFLCSLFIGLGITATTEAPLPLFVGLGVGFLFFVDPVYEKLMEKIENL